MSASEWTHVLVEEILLEGPNAMLLRIKGKDVWVPYSQIADHEDYKNGDRNVEISIKKWLANKEGWDEE